MSISVEGAQRSKSVLEDAIMELIRRYEFETGLVVANATLHHNEKVGSMEHTTAVNLTVRLHE